MWKCAFALPEWGTMRTVARRVEAVVISLLVASAAAGCGRGEEPASKSQRPATPIPATTSGASAFPVAYQLRKSATLELAGADAWRVIERNGRVVAKSEWNAYTAVVLSEWLEDRGVRLEVPRDLRSVVRRVASEQELSLLIVSSEHRRYADALAQLRPTARELRSFYEHFTADESTDAGQAMLDWLRVFRLAIGNADADHLVVIPVLD
jgi:hypothetical protein